MSERDPEGRVTTEARGRIWLMGFDRPEKLNGLTPKMFDELTAAYRRLEDDDELWIGILFGHGDHFTAGLDLPKFAERMQQGIRSSEQNDVDLYGLTRKLSKPMICAMRGITYTAGIEMMLASDIGVAASDCRFSQLEPKRGIMATGGATIRFVERGGYGNAMYHLLTCDEFDAQEAYRIGLVQEIVEPGSQLDRAVELAEQIADMAPLAVRATKASSLKFLREGEEAAVAAFAATQKMLSQTDDAREGVASFKEKRTPVFKGL